MDFSAISLAPRQLAQGSIRKIDKPRTGSLPSATNNTPATTIVISSAKNGEPSIQALETSARASSLNMLSLRPQTAHPLPNQRHAGLGARNTGRQRAFGNHLQAI